MLDQNLDIRCWERTRARSQHLILVVGSRWKRGGRAHNFSSSTLSTVQISPHLSHESSYSKQLISWLLVLRARRLTRWD